MMIFIIWQVSAFISFLAKNKDGYFDKTTKIVIWFNYNLTIFVNLAIITNEMVINNHGLFLTLMIISLIINPILLIYYIKIFRQRV